MDKKMRKAYKNRDPFLTKERISLLNQLGIAWEVKRKPSWDDYYNIASEFYKKIWTCKYPLLICYGRRVYAWTMDL